MKRALLLATALALVGTSPAVAGGRHKSKHAKTPKQAPAPKPDEKPAGEIDFDTPPPPAEPAAPAPQAVDEEPTTGSPRPEARGPDAGGPESTTVRASAAPRAQHHRLYLRAGVAYVHPFASSREMELADISGAASLAVENGPIAGSGATVSSATIPAMIIGYQLPWLRGHLAVETVLGVPFTVKFRATGTLANMSIAPSALGIPTGVPPLGPELGEAKAAPPILTLDYNLLPHGKVHPFVGAGAAVMFAYGAKVTNPMLVEVSQPDMSISPAPGLVLHTGLDASLGHHLHARLDVKYIAFMLAHGEVHHIQVRTPELPLFDTVEVGTAKMNVWVNPLIVQAGIGADF